MDTSQSNHTLNTKNAWRKTMFVIMVLVMLLIVLVLYFVVGKTETDTEPIALGSISSEEDTYVVIVDNEVNKNLVQSTLKESEIQLRTVSNVNSIYPTGCISMCAGSLPSGWVWCNGASYSKTDPKYTNLFSVIGNTYGETEDTFKVPNLNNRIPVGVSTNTDYLLGKTGGAETVTLTASHLPRHSHTVENNSFNHTHAGFNHINSRAGGTSVAGYKKVFKSHIWWRTRDVRTSNAGNHSHSVQSFGVNANTPHNNLPPYFAIHYMIKL